MDECSAEKWGDAPRGLQKTCMFNFVVFSHLTPERGCKTVHITTDACSNRPVENYVDNVDKPCD